MAASCSDRRLKSGIQDRCLRYITISTASHAKESLELTIVSEMPRPQAALSSLAVLQSAAWKQMDWLAGPVGVGECPAHNVAAIQQCSLPSSCGHTAHLRGTH
jgi:hypothetical protein